MSKCFQCMTEFTTNKNLKKKKILSSGFEKLLGPVVWCLILIWGKSIIIIFHIFLLFFSLLSFGYSHFSYVQQLFHSLLIFCFFSLCSLCLSVFKDSTAVCSSSEILSSAMSSLLIAPQRCSSFYYTGFISSTSFWFFLSISICLHCPSVLTC